jgi:hypothetical protein
MDRKPNEHDATADAIERWPPETPHRFPAPGSSGAQADRFSVHRDRARGLLARAQQAKTPVIVQRFNFQQS